MFCQMETTMIVTVAIVGVPNQLMFASQFQPNASPSAGIAFVKINTQIKDTNTALTIVGNEEHSSDHAFSLNILIQEISKNKSKNIAVR